MNIVLAESSNFTASLSCFGSMLLDNCVSAVALACEKRREYFQDYFAHFFFHFME